MNQLKVNQQETIVALHRQGWSKRRIARELRVDRVTVRRYLAAEQEAKSPNNPRTGSAVDLVAGAGALELANFGPESLCEPWKEGLKRHWLRACRFGASTRIWHQM
ncbi:MAG TPA: helix-turn-helix domain-containing protein [Verrucomicrobiae bacterium]|nr:helix-turn-helix domain-containing protein [Verrucomicrobiae bacterium]